MRGCLKTYNCFTSFPTSKISDMFLVDLQEWTYLFSPWHEPAGFKDISRWHPDVSGSHQPLKWQSKEVLLLPGAPASANTGDAVQQDQVVGCRHAVNCGWVHVLLGHRRRIHYAGSEGILYFPWWNCHQQGQQPILCSAYLFFKKTKPFRTEFWCFGHYFRLAWSPLLLLLLLHYFHLLGSWMVTPKPMPHSNPAGKWKITSIFKMLNGFCVPCV